MNELSCGVRMWTQVSFVLSQTTRLTDGTVKHLSMRV